MLTVTVTPDPITSTPTPLTYQTGQVRILCSTGWVCFGDCDSEADVLLVDMTRMLTVKIHEEREEE